MCYWGGTAPNVVCPVVSCVQQSPTNGGPAVAHLINDDPPYPAMTAAFVGYDLRTFAILLQLLLLAFACAAGRKQVRACVWRRRREGRAGPTAAALTSCPKRFRGPSHYNSYWNYNLHVLASQARTA